MRRAHKVDGNQRKIVATLRAAGASVQILSSVGQGVPDLLVGLIDRRLGDGRNLLMEVKDGSKPPSARELTPDEADWHHAWLGPVVVVKNEEEALYAIGLSATVFHIKTKGAKK